jgi:YVTN family beta-propeller protein
MAPVGQRPWGIAISPDGQKVYTANGLSNDVSVIDASTNTVVATIKAGDGPWGIALYLTTEGIGKDGFLWRAVSSGKH